MRTFTAIQNHQRGLFQRISGTGMTLPPLHRRTKNRLATALPTTSQCHKHHSIDSNSTRTPRIRIVSQRRQHRQHPSKICILVHRPQLITTPHHTVDVGIRLPITHRTSLRPATRHSSGQLTECCYGSRRMASPTTGKKRSNHWISRETVFSNLPVGLAEEVILV